VAIALSGAVQAADVEILPRPGRNVAIRDSPGAQARFVVATMAV
jgi:hypothetical protein